MICLYPQPDFNGPRAKKESAPYFGKRIFPSPGHGLRLPILPYLNFFTPSESVGVGRSKKHLPLA
jgi:hypothetical protein